jgi:putative transposase
VSSFRREYLPPTEEGWLYVSATLDLYGRPVVGWAMSDRMTTDLTMDALKMAADYREIAPGLIHDSDKGSQYTDGEFQQLLKDWGIEVSMNGVGSWYDNAPMESFFETLKGQWVHQSTYRARQEAMSDSFYCIEAFHNRHRIHSLIGYLSPIACGRLYHQGTNLVKLPVRRIGGT